MAGGRRTAKHRDSQQALARRERQKKALDLRKGGASYAEIAHEFGYSAESTAWRLVQAALKEITREPAEDVLILELQRLDRLQRGYWVAALRGDVRAGQTILRIMDRRAALLGLDAMTVDPSDDVRAALREMLGEPPAPEVRPADSKPLTGHTETPFGPDDGAGTYGEPGSGPEIEF